MMTLTTAKAITLSLAIGLAYTAAAESFNDRGEDFLTQIKPGLPSAAVEVVASPSHFNDRSGDFPAYLQSGPRVLQQAVAVTPSHFNDRGDPDRSLTPAVTEPSPLTAGAEPAPPRVHTTAAGS
jgi:hypothetical protein